MAKPNASGAKREGKAGRRSTLSQRVVSGVVLALAAALIIVGVYGVNLRVGEEGAAFLTRMRARAVLARTTLINSLCASAVGLRCASCALPCITASRLLSSLTAPSN